MDAEKRWAHIEAIVVPYPRTELVDDPLGLMGLPGDGRRVDVEPECDCGLLCTGDMNAESIERADRIECDKTSLGKKLNVLKVLQALSSWECKQQLVFV